ncbi:unnamed protein product [Boreogadus saida]
MQHITIKTSSISRPETTFRPESTSDQRPLQTKVHLQTRVNLRPETTSDQSPPSDQSQPQTRVHFRQKSSSDQSPPEEGPDGEPRKQRGIQTFLKLWVASLPAATYPETSQ